MEKVEQQLQEQFQWQLEPKDPIEQRRQQLDGERDETLEPVAAGPALSVGVAAELPEPEPEPEPEPAAAPPLAPINRGLMRNSSWVQHRPADTVTTQPAALETRTDHSPEMRYDRALQVMQNSMRKALSRRAVTGLRGIRDLGLALSKSKHEARRISMWEEM